MTGRLSNRLGSGHIGPTYGSEQFSSAVPAGKSAGTWLFLAGKNVDMRLDFPIKTVKT